MQSRSALILLAVSCFLAAGPQTCPPPPDPSPGVFVVAGFGDSITTGYGGAPGYVGPLAAAEPTWNVLDEGIAGECGSPHADGFLFCFGGFGAQRMRDAVEGLRQSPGIDAAVAMWGTNDARAGILFYSILGEEGLTMWRTDYRDTYVTDLMAAIDRARALRVKVLYVLPPMTYTQDSELWNQLLLEIRDAVLPGLQLRQIPIVDLYTASALDPAMIVPTDGSPYDGLHWTPHGAQVAAGLIAQALHQF